MCNEADNTVLELQSNTLHHTKNGLTITNIPAHSCFQSKARLASQTQTQCDKVHTDTHTHTKKAARNVLGIVLMSNPQSVVPQKR